MNSLAIVPSCLTGVVQGGELEASGRADVTLEGLAQRLSPGITASQSVYDRLVRDRQAIAMGWPEIAASIRFTRPYSGLLVLTSDATAEKMLAGGYTDWACLNAALGASAQSRFSGGVVMQFSGHPYLTLERVVKLYAALPDVRSSQPDYIYTVPERPLGYLDTGVTPGDDAWHYVIVVPSAVLSGAPTYYHFTTFANGSAAFIESWQGAIVGNGPTWLQTYWVNATTRQSLVN